MLPEADISGIIELFEKNASPSEKYPDGRNGAQRIVVVIESSESSLVELSGGAPIKANKKKRSGWN